MLRSSNPLVREDSEGDLDKHFYHILQQLNSTFKRLKELFQVTLQYKIDPQHVAFKTLSNQE